MTSSCHARRVARTYRFAFRPTLALGTSMILLAALPALAGEPRKDDPDTIVVNARQRASLTTELEAEAAARIARIPGGAALVPSSVFDRSYAQGFSETLALVPGVFAEHRYNEEERLSVRGSGLSRGFHLRGVELLVDGVPINLADGSGDFLEIDPLAAAYIEVYRGANALRYGAGGLGGAINLVSPTGRTSPARASLRLEGGSFDTGRAHATLALAEGPVDLFAATTLSSSEGWRRQSAASSGRLTGNLGWRISASAETRLYLTVNDIRQEVPGTLTKHDALEHPRAVPAASLLGDQARDIQSVRVASRTAIALGDATTLEFGGFLNVKNLYHPIFQVIDQESTDEGLFARLETSLFSSAPDLTLGVTWRTGTIDAKRFVNTAGKRGALTANAVDDAETWIAYGELRVPLSGSATLVAGGQYIHGERRYHDFLAPAASDSIAYDETNPKLGILWTPREDLALFANVSRSSELPTFSELVQAPVVGFVPLDPQTAWSAEAGLRGKAANIDIDLTLYRSWIEGEMLQFAVGPDIPASTFNADRTVHQGIELGLGAALANDLFASGDKVGIRAAYTFSDFHFDGDAQFGDNDIAGAPPHLLHAELRWSRGGWHVAPSLDLVPEAPYVDFANRLKGDAYALLGLSAGAPLSERGRIFVDARNLLDTRHITSFSTIADAATSATSVFYPGSGFALYAGIEVRF